MVSATQEVRQPLLWKRLTECPRHGRRIFLTATLGLPPHVLLSLGMSQRKPISQVAPPALGCHPQCPAHTPTSNQYLALPRRIRLSRFQTASQAVLQYECSRAWPKYHLLHVLTAMFCKARAGTKESHDWDLHVRSRTFSLAPCNSYFAVELNLDWSVNGPLS